MSEEITEWRVVWFPPTMSDQAHTYRSKDEALKKRDEVRAFGPILTTRTIAISDWTTVRFW